jgi:uncharacterized protein YkwD
MSGRRRSAAALLITLGCTAFAGQPTDARTPARESVYREPGRLPRIVLSKIEPLRGRGGQGATLGRPPAPKDAVTSFTVPKITKSVDVAAAIVATINADRRARGLRTLRVSAALSAAGAAHAHALGLSGAFTHDWPLTPRAPFGRWVTRYYGVNARRSWRAGENLVWTQDELRAEQALTAWLNSPSHRKILTAPYWHEIGVGVIRAETAGGVFGGRTVIIAAAEFGAR